MNLFWPRAPLLLLQTYFKKDNPVAALILLIGIGAVIVLAILAVIIKRVLEKMGVVFSSIRGPRRFSSFALRRAAQRYRLSGDQLRTLEAVLRGSDVSDPVRALANSPALDRYFKARYRVITHGSAEAADREQLLARLFSTRIAIEASPFGVTIDSLPRITERSAAVLRAAGKSYGVTVLNSTDRRLTINCPVNALGTPVPIPNGSRVALSFFLDATRGLAINAEVTDMIRDAKGTPILDLALRGKPETLVKRKSRRRQINIPCEMQPVSASQSGGKQVFKTDSKKFQGDIQDVSTGGCSVRVKGTLRPGNLIKISFTCRDGNAAVLGQILRINKGASLQSVIHVKFTRVPLKSMNVINATVFQYSEP